MCFLFLTEFVPYVFQIVSLLLELHDQGVVPEPYRALYPCLLMPALWERPGNIHPLVQLLREFIHKTAPAQMESTLELVSALTVVCICTYQFYKYMNKHSILM